MNIINDFPGSYNPFKNTSERAVNPIGLILLFRRDMKQDISDKNTQPLLHNTSTNCSYCTHHAQHQNEVTFHTQHSVY